MLAHPKDRKIFLDALKRLNDKNIKEVTFTISTGEEITLTKCFYY